MPNSASKRKANEITNADATPKLTKKQQLENARKKAREFAKRDKARFQNKVGSKPNQDSNDDVVEPKKKKQKTGSNESWKERAKEFGDRDKARLEGKKAANKRNNGTGISSTQSKSKSKHVQNVGMGIPSGAKISQRPINDSFQDLHNYSSNQSMTTSKSDVQEKLRLEQQSRLKEDHEQQRRRQQQKLYNLSNLLSSQQGHKSNEESRSFEVSSTSTSFVVSQATTMPIKKNDTSVTTTTIPVLKNSEKILRNTHRSTSAPFVMSKAATMPIKEKNDSSVKATKIPVLKKLPLVDKNYDNQQVLIDARNYQYEQNNDDNHDGNDDIIIPPGLQKQISQQVLKNARDFPHEENNDGNSSIDDVLVDDDGEELKVVKSYEGSIHTIPIHKRSKVKSCVVFFLAFFSLLFILMLPEPSSNEAVETINIAINEQQCFFDPKTGNEEICSIPCPRGGVCKDGELINCPNKFQVISVKKDQCDFSEEYLSMKMVIMNELVNRASSTCGKLTNRVEYDSLKKENPESLVESSSDLIDALKIEGYQIEEKEDRLYLHLPENYALRLPLYCKIGDAAHSVLGTIGHLLWTSIMILCANFLGFVKNYPKLSTTGLFVIGCFFMIHRRLVRREQRERDFDIVRQETYDFLRNNSDKAHAVIHIRDTISMQLYRGKRSQRQALNTDIWPKIVNIVRHDTRVKKSKRMIDGNAREMWQYVAAE